MIKTVSKIVVVYLMLFSVINTYGQGKMMGKLMDKQMNKYDALKKDMKSKELIIVLMEESDKVLEKFEKKQEKLDFYKKTIANYNSLIQELAEEHLDYFKGIKFKKISELASISTEERRNHYFMCYNIMGLSLSVFDDIEPGKEDKFLKRNKEMVIDKKNTVWVKIDLFAEKGYVSNSHYVTGANMPEVMPTKWSMTYALSTLKATYGGGAKSINEIFNKDKILLICDEDTDLTDEEIKKSYKYNYEVVSRADYAKAIIEKNPKYFYAVVAPFMNTETSSSTAITVSKIIFGNFFTDCATGSSLGMTTTSGTVGAIGGGAYVKINKGSLKKISKQLAKY